MEAFGVFKEFFDVLRLKAQIAVKSPSIFFGGKSTGTGKWILKLGIIAVGVALGVIVGNLLESAGMNEDVAYPATIFFFGGAALVAAYFISKKVDGDKE